MSTNSHHQVNQLDPTYTAYLQRLVFLLSKRIVWNIKGEKFDEQKWEVTFRKLHKNMHIMEKAREVNPKFSDIIKELADNLGIAADENWDLDSLSRLSSVSASRYGRRPSINLNTLRNGSLPLQSKDFDSINGSVDEQKKKWPFAKSGSKENKTMIALEKIVNSSVNYSKINTTRNEDQVLAEIKNSCNLPSTQDDQSAYFSKILKTDGEKPSTRVGTAKSEKPRPKKRANTPQFYYNGAFDIPTDLDSAKKKPKPPRARPSGFISSQENRPKTGYSFRTHDLNLSINKNDDSLLTQEPNVVNHSLNMTVNQTPLSVLDESCEFRALKPPRGRGLDQVVRSFKNQTETYGSGQFKNMTSKRSSFDSQVRGSRTKEPLGGDNPIKVVHNVQTIKMIYGSVFSEETVHEGVSENNAVV